MTNVPEPIRQAWKELYVLFDTNFNMDGSPTAWEHYWDQVNQLVYKYGDEVPLLEVAEAIAHMIECFCNQRKTGNKSLMWDKDDPYPHPRN